MQDQVFHEYLQLSRLLINKMNGQLTSNELYSSQWLILNYLKHLGPSSLVDISNYLFVEKSAITRTANRLEKSQLIKRIVVKDKRERRIALTDKGEELYSIGRVIVDDIEGGAMDGIPQEEQDRFFETLRKIKVNVNK